MFQSEGSLNSNSAAKVAFERCARMLDQYLDTVGVMDEGTAIFLTEMGLQKDGTSLDPALSSVFLEHWSALNPSDEHGAFKCSILFLIDELVNLRNSADQPLVDDCLRAKDSIARSTVLFPIWERLSIANAKSA